MSPASATILSANLATCYQEILTVAARLRSRKFSVGDSAVFRTQIRKGLQQAETSAQSLRYEPDDIRLASFAVVALLDETILNLSNPAFRDWARNPLQLDLYKTGQAGETFFEYLNSILQKKETKATIDVLEVYVLCLLLGYRGRYSTGAGDQLRRWRDAAVEKILRNRGVAGGVEITRGWAPESTIEMPAVSRRWSQVALSCAVGILGALIVLFVGYQLLLSRGTAVLDGFVSR